MTFVVEYRTVGAGSGPTIRVVGADDSHEYLRFDMFSEGPHYHYSPPTTPDPEATERILKLDRKNLNRAFLQARAGGFHRPRSRSRI